MCVYMYTYLYMCICIYIYIYICIHIKHNSYVYRCISYVSCFICCVLLPNPLVCRLSHVRWPQNRTYSCGLRSLSSRMYLYIYIYIYTYNNIYISLHISLSLYIYIYIYIYIYLCIYGPCEFLYHTT